MAASSSTASGDSSAGRCTPTGRRSSRSSSAAGGGEPMPVVALVPMSDLQIIDDWYTAGMKGSGSVSTVATDLFIPQERVLPIFAILAGQSASPENAASPIYRAP